MAFNLALAAADLGSAGCGDCDAVSSLFSSGSPSDFTSDTGDGEYSSCLMRGLCFLIRLRRALSLDEASNSVPPDANNFLPLFKSSCKFHESKVTKDSKFSSSFRSSSSCSNFTVGSLSAELALSIFWSCFSFSIASSEFGSH